MIQLQNSALAIVAILLISSISLIIFLIDHLNRTYNILNAEFYQFQTIRRDDVTTTPFR